MKRFGILLVTLALSSMACVALLGKPAQSPAQAPASQATVQPPLIQLPNLPGVQLGDEVRNERCGYTFRKIPDYKFVQDESTETMTAPGADSSTGPMIGFLCGTRNTASTNEDVIRELTTAPTLNATGTPEASPLTYSNQKSLEIGGVNALSVDVGGTGDAGGTVKGREVVAMVTPHRLLMVIGMASTDKWEEMRPYFEAVVNSVSFFEPTITPTANP